jgi:hypothetical protein
MKPHMPKARSSAPLTSRTAIEKAVARAVDVEPVVDMHTHLYPPSFGTPLIPKGFADPSGLLLWGVDELLTYHYLIAELFRVVNPSELSYDRFWQMSKARQADLVWQKLFIERSPISEAARGVLTSLHNLGLSTADRKLDKFRAHFNKQDPSAHVDQVMKLANVASITMTNNVFDDNERQRWLKDPSVGSDGRFKPVLRFDPLICDWRGAAKKLAGWGYNVGDKPHAGTVAEVRRFLGDWLDRTRSIYAAVSLPPSWRFPALADADDAARAGQEILVGAVLPACAERRIPLAMMIGSQRGVNPALRDAADMGFAADVMSVANLCRDFPSSKFLVTMLSLQNQHELAVAARKFSNLMVFGCWWFLNNPSIIEQMTRLRTELLGVSYIPQHSDARVLDQLLYKWDHSRRIIARVLADKYDDLRQTGWKVTAAAIHADVARYFRGNFSDFLSR